MNNDQIRKLALDNGFKLKQQPNGDEDLNPYVYDFARALLSQAKRDQENLDAEILKLKGERDPYFESGYGVDFGGISNPNNPLNNAIESSDAAYLDARSKAEEKINNGARITKHRIDLGE